MSSGFKSDITSGPPPWVTPRSLHHVGPLETGPRVQISAHVLDQGYCPLPTWVEVGLGFTSSLSIARDSRTASHKSVLSHSLKVRTLVWDMLGFLHRFVCVRRPLLDDDAPIDAPSCYGATEKNDV